MLLLLLLVIAMVTAVCMLLVLLLLYSTQIGDMIKAYHNQAAELGFQKREAVLLVTAITLSRT